MKRVYLLVASLYFMHTITAADANQTGKLLSLLPKTQCPQKGTFSPEILNISSPESSDAESVHGTESQTREASLLGKNSPVAILSPTSLTDRSDYLSSVLFGRSLLHYLRTNGGDFLTDIQRDEGLVGHVLTLDERSLSLQEQLQEQKEIINALQLKLAALGVVFCTQKKSQSRLLRTSPVLETSGHQFLFTESTDISPIPEALPADKWETLVPQKDNPSLATPEIMVAPGSGVETEIAPFEERLSHFKKEEAGNRIERVDEELRRQNLNTKKEWNRGQKLSEWNKKQ